MELSAPSCRRIFPKVDFTPEKLFTPQFPFPYPQLSAIRAVLGSPPEAVCNHWRSLPKRNYVRTGWQDCPSVLDARMDVEFPPGAEDLKDLVRSMLQYDPEQRISLHECLHGFSLPRINDQENRLSRTPECPSMDFLSQSRRGLPTLVTGTAATHVSPPPIPVRELSAALR
jgi:serine/threonine protein kinase